MFYNLIKKNSHQKMQNDNLLTQKTNNFYRINK